MMFANFGLAHIALYVTQPLRVSLLESGVSIKERAARIDL